MKKKVKANAQGKTTAKRSAAFRKLTPKQQATARRRWERNGANVPGGWIPPLDYEDAGNIIRFEVGTDRAPAERAVLNANAPTGEFLMSGGVPVDEESYDGTAPRYCPAWYCQAQLAANGNHLKGHKRAGQPACE